MNKKNGKGIISYPNGTVFEGYFREDMANGNARIWNKDYSYKGNFINGEKAGKGIELKI